MTLLIADTFTDSLARLTGDEQKAVKTTAFDLQLNPSSPGMSFHKLDRARDKNFWSVRVSADIRVIVHKTGESLLLCYVDHHDKAYDWAERRKVETHPTTGAAQLVEVRETVREIAVPRYVTAAEPAKRVEPQLPLFATLSADDLLSYGVPEEWIADVLTATDATILDIADHLPREAAEAILELAVGGTPAKPGIAAATVTPFAHPDAQRRFRVMNNIAELKRALEFPWEKWSVFLHPSQREIVERKYSGPARVAGSAGTGKTIVALHRAVHLARANPQSNVLITTFSVTLARMLAQKLSRLTSGDDQLSARIRVAPLDDIAIDLHERWLGTPQRAKEGMITKELSRFSKEVGGHSFSDKFLLQEWNDVVDAWQLDTWEQYRNVARLGRKTRLNEKQRTLLWSIFSRVLESLKPNAIFTQQMIYRAVSEELASSGEVPFDFVIVDEAQDVDVGQLRFLAALAGDRPGALFFAGDLGQRIFQTPFSWKSLGVDVRGRSSTLRINYRTSHQIRRQADRLLGSEISDVDGNVEGRAGTVSVFNSAEPTIRLADSETDEGNLIAEWIGERIAEGILPQEIGVFVRSSAEVPRARAAIAKAGLGVTAPAAGVDAEVGKIVLLPMHYAKGLEFRAVVVAACDDDVLPLQSRIEDVTDSADLEEVYNTERHLLYVACTRARDHLLVTAVKPGSEFLADLVGHI